MTAERSWVDQWWKTAAVGALIFAVAYICLAVPRELGRAAPIWLSNGVMLAVLLTSPRASWWRLIPAGAAGNLAANLAIGDTLPVSIGLALANLGEYGLAAGLLARRAERGPDDGDLGEFKGLANFALIAAAGAGLSAAIAKLALGQRMGLDAALVWMVADFAGLVIVTPCVLVLLIAKRPLRLLAKRPFWPLGILLVVSLATFVQDRYALAYFVTAALMLVAWRAGLLGAAVGVLGTLVIALSATLTGRGPFALGDAHSTEQVLALQAFLAVCFYVSIPIALQRRRSLQLRESLKEALHNTQEAEARYRLIAERMHDLVVRYYPQGPLFYVSPSSLRTLGYRPEELIGVRPMELVHPDDVERLRAEGRRIFDRDAARAEEGGHAHRFRTKAGDYVWLEGNPTIIRDAEGRPVEVLNVLRDITARKAMEADLEAARLEAEAAARVKSEFLANMSHEIRTPLTSVVGFTRLALEQPDLPPLARTYVERVGDASRALLSTVNDILDFSKLEAGQVSFEPEPTPLEPLLRQALSLFEPQAGAKDLTLKLEADIPEGATVLVDPNRLRQVLLNLVGNAVKFTTHGQVVLRAAYEPAAERLSVEIEDTGPGIAPEAQVKLFQRFSQVDGALTRAHGGTGLGLAICKGIVEALGGEIGLRSTLGAGSTFHFAIPAPAADGDESAQAAEAVGPVGGLSVLVVDDHAVNRELAELFLAGVGVTVTPAAGGAEAVELAARQTYDVILMDLRMPEVDGQAAMRRIRNGGGPNAATPILAFTADADPDLQTRLAAMDFQGVVAKPLEAEGLIAAVAAAAAGPADSRLRAVG
ncbi:MAG: ATP-binding protein [Phenylobacterium sp.]|uniref:ATP-binding protein n=1 Tax=Phenylobacterium sp. TaxID=1871053 RepID=UPI002A37148D|nr:ATP-binding protein [Phenylobacterium sp.]MDX9999290.1 ATP-binding protein [Phenylobacterium sp.]